MVLCSSLLCARRRCRTLSAQTSLIASLRRVARLIVLNELVELVELVELGRGAGRGRRATGPGGHTEVGGAGAMLGTPLGATAVCHHNRTVIG